MCNYLENKLDNQDDFNDVSELAQYSRRFSHMVMKNGKAEKADKIIEKVLEKIYQQKRVNPGMLDEGANYIMKYDFLNYLYFMLRRVRPMLYLKKVIMQGKSVSIPTSLKEDKEISLALNWLGKMPVIMRDKSLRCAEDCFYFEFLNISARKGICFKYREDLNKKIAMSYFLLKKASATTAAKTEEK